MNDRNYLAQWEGEDYGDHYWVSSVSQAKCIIPDDCTGYRISEHLKDGSFETIEEDGNLDNFETLEPTDDRTHLPFC